MDEVLQMGQEDIKRHHIIRSVLEGHATQMQAAAVLGVTDRQIRRLCARVRAQGAKGVIHGLRGRPSNHQLREEKLELALCAVHDEVWEGFGPTFASEKLEQLHGITMGVETLRQLMIQTEAWKPGRHGARHRSWRPRRPCVGMLVQLDGSDHDWFEGRGPRCALLIYIDDATSQILHGEFADVEDTLTLMHATQRYLRRLGRPVAFYVDRDSIYKVNQPLKDGGAWRQEEPMTQFGRAMKDLGIEVIFAYSPQAKGRVERGFDTHQDRLVKELRLRGISNMADANRYLQDYILEHNKRFSVEPAAAGNAHRPLLATQRLEQILSLRTERTLMNDNTLRHENKFYQVLEHQLVRVGPGDKVEVEERLDGTTHLRFNGVYLNAKPIDKRAYRPLLVAQPSRGKVYADPRTKGVGSKPAKDHPWRRLFAQGPYRAALPWRGLAAV